MGVGWGGVGEDILFFKKTLNFFFVFFLYPWKTLSYTVE